MMSISSAFFFFQAEDGIRDYKVTGVQTCALPIFTDRATYLTWREKLQLFPMVEGDSLLYNVYHVLELNPKNASRINVVGGKALADFLVTPETQRLIGEYGKSRFGQSLFVPDAGKEPSR